MPRCCVLEVWECSEVWILNIYLFTNELENHVADFLPDWYSKGFCESRDKAFQFQLEERFEHIWTPQP